MPNNFGDRTRGKKIVFLFIFLCELLSFLAENINDFVPFQADQIV